MNRISPPRILTWLLLWACYAVPVASADVLIAGKWDGEDFNFNLLNRGGITGAWGEKLYNLSFYHDDSEIVGTVTSQQVRLVLNRADLRLWGATACGAIDVMASRRTRYVSGTACNQSVILRVENGTTDIESLLLQAGLAHLLEAFPPPVRPRLYDHMTERLLAYRN